ncbi:MAG: lipopolysaccharide biosynthesis protein [Sphingomonadales bacterium]
MADVRDIFRGALASLGGFGGRLIARIILMIVAGQQFGAVELGVLGQVAAIVEILTAIGVMGLKRSLLNMLSLDAKEKQPIGRRVLEAITVSTIVALALSLLLALVWPSLFPDRPEIPVILIFAIPAMVFTEVSLTAIKFKRIIKWDVISRGILEPWSFLIFSVTLYLMGIIHNGLIIAYAGSLIVSGLVGLTGVFKAFGARVLFENTPNLKNCLSLPKRSWPVGITDIGIMMFRRIDILILALFTGHGGTGVYYMVQQIVTVPQKINQLFEPMMSPVVAKLHHDFDVYGIRLKLVGFCRWVFTIQIGLTLPFLVYGDYILGIFGDQFLVGWLVLSLVLIAELLDGSFALMETPLLFSKPKVPPFLIIMTLIIEVSTIYYFSSIWGVFGTGVGFLIAMASLALGRIIMLNRHLNIFILDKSYIPPLFISIIVGGILYTSRFIFSTESAITVSISIFLGLVGYYYLVKFFGLTKVDRILLRRLLK